MANQTSFKKGKEHPNWRGGVTDKQREEKTRQYYLDNKEHLKEKAKLYYQENREAVLLKKKGVKKVVSKEKAKEYRERYREKRKAWLRENKLRVNKVANERAKQRRLEDINYKMACNLRHRVNMALNSNRKRGSAINDLGCTLSELKIHLEELFQPGMTWSNWSPKGWHIDHVKPLASFDLSDREQFLQASHYTNLQPLWAEDNYIKSDNIYATTY